MVDYELLLAKDELSTLQFPNEADHRQNHTRELGQRRLAHCLY